MEKLNRAAKCSILGPQNLGSGGGPGPPGPPLDPRLLVYLRKSIKTQMKDQGSGKKGNHKLPFAIYFKYSVKKKINSKIQPKFQTVC